MDWHTNEESGYEFALSDSGTITYWIGNDGVLEALPFFCVGVISDGVEIPVSGGRAISSMAARLGAEKHNLERGSVKMLRKFMLNGSGFEPVLIDSDNYSRVCLSIGLTVNDALTALQMIDISKCDGCNPILMKFQLDSGGVAEISTRDTLPTKAGERRLSDRRNSLTEG